MDNILRLEKSDTSVVCKVVPSIRRYGARFCNRGQIHLDQTDPVPPIAIPSLTLKASVNELLGIFNGYFGKYGKAA